MKPFNFAPIASGAAKVQPMSASDITRINRIRAANAAYPNILSNPPKNIGNLALSQTVISSFHMNNAINRGIFNYNPVITNTSNNDVSGGGVQPDYGQPIDSARIIDGKFRVVFTFNKPITDFNFAYIRNGSQILSTDFTVVDITTILDTNIYLLEDDGVKLNTGISPLTGDNIVINGLFNNGEPQSGELELTIT